MSIELPENQDKPLAMTYIVCGVILEQRGKYLLVQEKNPKVYGKWNMPAGKVDQGETLEEAAVREAREETGFSVRLTGSLLLLHPEVDMPVFHSYAADIIGGELHFPKDELLDAKWFSYGEIVAMKNELRNEPFLIGSLNMLREHNANRD